MQIDIQDLKEGDRFYDGDRLVWEALEDARFKAHYSGREIHARVRFADGGLETRVWNVGSVIEVRRA